MKKITPTALTVSRSARRAALVVIAPCSMEDHCTGERPISIDVKPWCAVPAAASNTQPAFAWRARERTTALAVSREEAQYGCLRHARAMLRWLWSLYARGKATLLARGPSPSVQGRGVTCQLRPPTHSRRSRCAHATAPLRLLFSGRGVARALATRARRAAPVLVALRTIQGHCTNERPLSSLHRRKTVVRQASYVL